MATKVDTSLFPSNSTDALFRQWCTFIHDTFVTTGGWTNTGDTGQINLSTVTAPAGANTKQGYKIYAMADSLQATSPVYIRVDFGSAGLAANPGVWVTIGTGSNGSGTITGIAYNGGAVTNAIFGSSGNNTATANTSWGSADTNRFAVQMFVNSSQNTRGLTFCIERSKDFSGADTGTAILMYGVTVATGTVAFSRYIILAGGSQPGDEVGLQCILSIQNPTTFGGNVGVGLPVPMAGSAQQPGTNMVLVRSSDFSAESQFNMSVYGATRTYQLGNNMSAHCAQTAASYSNVRVGIRYD